MELYSLSRKCLQEGGFTVQSCNSSCDHLRGEMRRDGTLSVHEDSWEKLLGYRYNALLMHLLKGGYVLSQP